MGNQAIDFTKVHTKSYRVWRILQAPGAWAQVYRDREARLRNFRTALIFPEQVLGLNQNSIFRVRVGLSDDGSLQSSIRARPGFYIAGMLNGRELPLTSLDDIRAWEVANQVPDEIRHLHVWSPGSEWTFATQDFFSSVRDAARYQNHRQNQLLSQIG